VGGPQVLNTGFEIAGAAPKHSEHRMESGGVAAGPEGLLADRAGLGQAAGSSGSQGVTDRPGGLVIER